MKFRSPFNRLGWRAVTILTLSLAWSTLVFGETIRMGGGPPVDFSNFTVVYQETFDKNQAPDTVFWGVLEIGQKANDPWTGLLAKGAYALAHKGRSGAVRYYFRNALDQSPKTMLSEYALSIDVTGEFTEEPSGAGLLYAYDSQTKHYLAFVKGAANAYAIYRRDGQGMRRLIQGTSKAVRSGQPNQLAIVPQGSGINFYINGVQVAVLKNEAPLTGAAGLLAISSGMFAFDNFTLYQPPRPTTALPDSDTVEKTPIGIDAAQIQPRTEEQTASRRKMLQSYEKVLKTGMSKQQVIQLFGDPSFERGPRFFYELNEDAPGQGGKTLVIQFDENDTLMRFKTL